MPSGDRHFSDTRVEGGIAAPLGLSLPYDRTLILQSQLDTTVIEPPSDTFAARATP